MIVFLGGESCTGKTRLAQTLLEHYSIPYLSLDHLKMGWIRAGQASFQADSPDETIAAALWPIVKGIAQTAIENRQHLTMEGCYLLPSLMDEFRQQFPSQTLCFAIGFSAGYIQNHLDSGILANRCVIEYRKFPEERSAEEMIRQHRHWKTQCGRYHIPYFEIEADYPQAIARIVEWVGEQRKQTPGLF